MGSSELGWMKKSTFVEFPILEVKPRDSGSAESATLRAGAVVVSDP